MTDEFEEPSTAQAADALVKKLVDAVKLTKWHVRLLGLGLVLALVALAAGGYVVWQNHNQGAALKADSVQSCQQSNQTRALDKEIWDEFIALLLSGNSNPAAQAEGKAFESKVAVAYAARNCTAEFSNVGSTGANPGAGTAIARTDAVTWSVVHLQSWDGACLSIPNANAGTRVDQVACGSDHAWVYSSAGQLSPQGHTNVAVGDSGGYMVLKAPGTSSVSDTGKAGPGGYYYNRMYFGVGGTYWHANGAGQNVSLISANSDADYWAFTGNDTENLTAQAAA